MVESEKKSVKFFPKLRKLCPSVKIPFNAGTEPMKYDEENICKKTQIGTEKNWDEMCALDPGSKSIRGTSRLCDPNKIDTEKDVFLLIISKNV